MKTTIAALALVMLSAGPMFAACSIHSGATSTSALVAFDSEKSQRAAGVSPRVRTQSAND